MLDTAVHSVPLNDTLPHPTSEAQRAREFAQLLKDKFGGKEPSDEIEHTGIVGNTESPSKLPTLDQIIEVIDLSTYDERTSQFGHFGFIGRSFRENPNEVQKSWISLFPNQGNIEDSSRIDLTLHEGTLNGGIWEGLVPQFSLSYSPRGLNSKNEVVPPEVDVIFYGQQKQGGGVSSSVRRIYSAK